MGDGGQHVEAGGPAGGEDAGNQAGHRRRPEEADELAERIAAKLGNADFDPHGDPIPSADLDVTERETRSLDEIDVGETVRFVRVSDADPAMLRYLSARGIDRGATIEVVGREPFGGPLTVRAEGREHALGDELARAMRIELA